jgi:hypothetical protein
MGNIKQLLNNPMVLIGLEVVVAVAVSALLVAGVILPKYQSWWQSYNENKDADVRFEKVEKNIESLRSSDAFEIDELNKSLELLLPDKEDPLRFASLAEKVAAVSGMELSSAALELPKTTTPAPTAAGGSSAPALSSGSGKAGGGSSTTATAVSAQTKKEPTVKLSFGGTFPSLLVLLANFEKTDRAALLSTLSLSEAQKEEGKITATIEFKLPMSSQANPVSMESATVLTQTEKKSLQDLLAKIQITTAPTNSPLGREDPFK